MYRCFGRTKKFRQVLSLGTHINYPSLPVLLRDRYESTLLESLHLNPPPGRGFLWFSHDRTTGKKRYSMKLNREETATAILVLEPGT